MAKRKNVVTVLDTVDKFTEEEKAQARKNIGAVSQEEVSGAPITTKDIKVTNPLGSIEKFSTISAGTKLESILTSALTVYTPAKIGSFVVNPNISLREKGMSYTINGLSFSVTAGSNNITGYAFSGPSGYAFSGSCFVPGNEDAKANLSKAFGESISIVKNETYRASAFVENEGSITASTEVKFVVPYFYGVSDSIETINLDDGTKKIETKGNKTYNFNTSGENKCLWFAQDASYPALKEIIDKNGFNNFNDFAISSTTYSGNDLKVYYTTAAEGVEYNGIFTFNY